ncbi:hypothetical protein KEM54_006572 [Ascosphaera aggregata]|nr:hypothetical protein KEM54_006572 [Ascosphaera aggregata]
MADPESQRTSTTLPFTTSRASIQSQPPIMDNERAVTYLDSLLGRTLRVHTSDERLFVGEFKCTDRDRNIILGLTHEYRYPTASSVNAAAVAAAATGSGSGSERNDDADGSETASIHESETDSSAVASALAASCQTQTVMKVNMTSRFIGLVVLPGEHIVKVEVEG